MNPIDSFDFSSSSSSTSSAGHLVCVGNACLWVPGIAPNECDEVLGCGTQSHMVCDASNRCVMAPGAGPNACSTTGSLCTVSSTSSTSFGSFGSFSSFVSFGSFSSFVSSASSSIAGSHLVCQGNACVRVLTPGSNECSLALGCNQGSHTECQNGSCITVPGTGANSCSPALGCGGENHTACVGDLCRSISGPGGNSCTNDTQCITALCGNAIINPGETCDDGNRTNGDGCSSSCTRETTVQPGSICGDGMLTPPETCDDRNRISGDGCSSVCQAEQALVVSCGDAIATPGEECDDGNLLGNDGCSASCTREILPAPPACGDGILTAPESCDDRNRADSDGCSSFCILEAPRTSRCGDSIATQGEECDDGNTLSGDGCTSRCLFERRGCNGDQDCRLGTCVSGTCVAPRVLSMVAAGESCGDGVLQKNEECDDGDQRDRDGCSSFCLLEQGFCGDGILQKALGETCEPFLHDPSLSFSCNSATCRFLSQTCGNGQREDGEECDEGMNNSDAPTASCHTDCSLPRCGDRMVGYGESCDDGNLLNGDGCSAFCIREAGATMTIPFPSPSTLGNAMIDPLRIPSAPSTTRGVPWQFPLASIQPITTSHPPAGDTGPAAVVVIAAGAGAGLAWVRRRRGSP